MKKHLSNLRKPNCTNHFSLVFRVIGLITLALTLNISAFAANEYLLSERVTLQVDNVSLKDAFKEIEKQSEFTFLYNDASIDVNQIITVSTRELSVKDILDKILDDKGINYTIVDNQIVLTKLSAKQEDKKTLSGTITDSETGEGLPGVTVVEKGTSNGTITDLDGNYTMNVAENASVIVSYVGYITEEVSAAGVNELSLSLIQDIISLDDVVVIGYGTVKKSDLTGAVASVSSEELEQSAVSGVDQALQGRTAGVSVTSNSGSPGTAPMVRIRGMATVTSPDPLFVVDGVPVPASTVGSLNPGDIESTEILKDASAGAIYGARAGNGVVLITTKKGKAGKSSVDFSYYQGIQSVAKKIDVTNAEEFITIRNASGAAMEDPASVTTDTDWQDEIFRPAGISNYQLSFLGGSEKIRYAMTGSYFDQKGVIGQDYMNDPDLKGKDAKGSDYKRYTFRVNTSADVKPWLTVGENVSYSNSTRNRLPEQNEWTSVVISALTMDPAVSPVFGDSVEVDNPYNVYPSAQRNNVRNPYGIIMRNHDKVYRNQLLGNVYIDLKPVKWLTFRTSYGTEITRDENEQYLPEYYESADANRPVNIFHNSKYTTTSWIWENTMSFNQTFAEKHAIQALVGYSRQKTVYRYFGGTTSNIPLDENLWFFSNANPGDGEAYFEDLSSDIGGIAINNYIPYDASLVSYLGRAIYSYDGKYDLTASIRRDGSSRFMESEDGGKVWGWFPSFAAGWKIHEEVFFQNISAVSFFKLRAGWGKLGNQEIDDYAPYTSVDYGFNYTMGSPQVSVPGAAPRGMGNTDLTWEESVMTNIGLDINLFENRIALNLDYFVKNTSKMLVAVPIPYYVGVENAPYANRGEVQNSGFELNATYKDKFGDFSYSINGNVAFLKNEVTLLPQDIDGGAYRSQGYTNLTQQGQPIASFYGYRTDGYWQSQSEINAANETATNRYLVDDEQAVPTDSIPYDNWATAPGDIRYVDINGDGHVDEDDQEFIGNPHPDLTYGINIDLNYKIFDLKIFGQGVYGNDLFYGLIWYHESPNAYFNMSPTMLDYWENEGDNSAVPRLDPTNANNNLRFSDRYIYSGSYFRIKNIQLGVNLPSDMAKAIGIERARVYVAGQNLITISSYPGFDPEVGRGVDQNNSRGVLDIGIDRGLYPVARSYMVGVNLTF